VASSLAIHKEICGPAALFFETFSPQELADRVVAVAQSQAFRAELSRAGYERSMAFSWKNHVERIIGLAKSLMPLG
jgi:glycosyltransferase involved in cell wall biosynthesis